jgi:exosortase D (VPLPA-CTERM-specific)
MDRQATVWKFPIPALAIITIGFLLIIPAFWHGLVDLISRWETQEEYSHGYLIPLVTAYLIWQRKEFLQQLEFRPVWYPVGLLILGLLLSIIGEISALYILIHISVILIGLSMAWSVMGWNAFKYILVPILLLFFAIPLPEFLQSSLTAELQLISSNLGVAFIRLFNIPVVAEGNVIDLGTFKLQVVEACSGLRYLYPLMSVGFIAAYMYQVELWKRIVLLLSVIPITILMNSLRIGTIGVFIEYRGLSMAEGFLHYFEGWIIFVTCLVILIGEMWLLNRIGNKAVSFGSAFKLPNMAVNNENTQIELSRRVAPPFIASTALILAALVIVNVVDQRVEVIPDRKSLVTFPIAIDGWQGEEESLLPSITDILELTDYVLNTYVDESNAPVNLYVAYYQSQRKGVAPHSPRVCIPGAGWSITGLKRISLDSENGEHIPVNRVVIQNEAQRQLVYYWFKQQGRDIANEYGMKWYLLVDSLTSNRTDGSLVRVSTPIAEGEDLAAGDRRLEHFVSKVNPVLDDYIPGKNPTMRIL